ncbi:MAG: hypothetical protein F4X02_10770 [Chloroflexi bacterium]|nr:hypothetical protein [Chloroflexota bacterium]
MNVRQTVRTFAAVLVLTFMLGGLAPGVSAAENYTELAAAIQAANSSGSGAITLGSDIVLTAPSPPITGALVIDGAGHAISGEGKHRVFDVAGGRLRLLNATLRDGKAPDGEDGGAIRMRKGARVIIENSTLSENLARNGGAIWAAGGSLEISDSHIEKNCAEIAAHRVDISLTEPRHEYSADDGCPTVTYVWPRAADVVGHIEGHGGAILLRDGARATVEDSTFSRNKATEGGAFATFGSDVHLVISGSNIRGSKSKRAGGAIYISGGSADISGSSFRDNSTEDQGGALFAESGSVRVSNATFYNNRASSSGGALLAAGADVTMTHVSMIDNGSTNASGEAIHRESGIVLLRNSLVSSPAPPDDCSGGLDQAIGNLSRDGTCADLPYSEDFLLGGLTGSPARYPLLDFSPAVDAAHPEFCLENDQNGTARPQGEGCDIGAIEAKGALPKPPPIEPPPPCPLALRIVAANTDAPAGGCPAGDGHDVITLNEDITLDEKLPNISSDITIEGDGHTISGRNRFRIFTVDAGTFTVNNLTLADGKATYGANDTGAAIWVQGKGSIVVNGSTFLRNAATTGGAIGGGSKAGRQSTIHNSRFVRNQATTLGGAIDWERGSSLKISNSSFHKNSASIGDGGAVGTLSGVIDISNSTFTQNWARSGGAVYARWSNVTLTHVTMFDNSAFPGAALMAEDRGFASDIGVVKLRNSLLAGGGRNQCGGRLTENAGNLIDDDSCSPKVSGDPLLRLPDEDSAPSFLDLLPGSPAIDAADSRYCARADQLGRERPRFSLCDIGAVESVPVSAAVADCLVTTKHTLNFREGPGGARFGAVPERSTVRATARTQGWFQVEHRGASGWISADYVVTEGACG